MTDSALGIKEKSIILSGGKKEDREAFVDAVKTAFHDRWPEGAVFQLSEHIKDSTRFLKAARSTFPIKPQLEGQKKYGMSYSQLNDSFLSWVGAKKAVLVVIPEFDKMRKAEEEYFYQVIGEFLAAQREGKTPLRFIMTLAGLAPIEFDRIPVLMGEGWKPSDKQISVLTL